MESVVKNEGSVCSVCLQHVLEPSIRSSLVNATRWFQTLAHQPRVAGVVGSVTLAAAAPVYDPKKFQELAPNKKVLPFSYFNIFLRLFRFRNHDLFIYLFLYGL